MKYFYLLIALLFISFSTACTSAEQTTESNDSVETNEEAQENNNEEAEEEAKAEAEEKAAEEKAIEEQKAKEEAAKKEKEHLQALGLEAVTVARVIDGDTIELSDGRKVRLIGVNTPESTNRTEDYGKEASNYTQSKLEGKQVWIQKDVSEADRYDRILRLVWLAIPTNDMDETEIRDKMFNADLVINGYAEPSTYPPDVKYSEHFVQFAREARENSTGLWAYGPEGTTKGDLDTGNSSNTTSSSKETSNNDSSTSTTGGSGKEYYKNCTELRKVYPDGVASDHPAYASKHDRDKDDWACER
ncbi:SPBc2 prophage-derived endonuclease YokF precursor [Bacillus sp. THAF10]|uniref:thermonuclease family protein n=1 Tax=Bacillus sp. THAF10 TaxID=2587848 RepID=UPI0012694EE6|nr:thermonuclease family protein [Bacillus sp. THAF10]QFT90823.1 SPBc2 prophage-derived endonuclease YokF precursor [Bacillus sp. THAF10]